MKRVEVKWDASVKKERCAGAEREMSLRREAWVISTMRSSTPGEHGQYWKCTLISLCSGFVVTFHFLSIELK
jgi:hypothetical protein